jgi:hypothetical protein
MKILSQALALLSLLVFSQTLFADGPIAPKTLNELKIAIEKSAQKPIHQQWVLH